MKNNILQPIQKADKHIKRHYVKQNRNGSTSWDTCLKGAPLVAFVASNLFRTEIKKELKEDIIKAAVGELILKAAVQSLKKVYQRRRPNGGDQSFPSAHTATSFLGSELLRQKCQNEHFVIACAGFTASAGVMALRLYHNRHWFSDLVCGAIIGVLSARLSHKLVHKVLS
ncbi:MAG: phosphatase PAP2 family protein [Bacteroidota bacterium]|nr:phosphatase PAP2 family protein [Bacteroidota bacterium]